MRWFNVFPTGITYVECIPQNPTPSGYTEPWCIQICSFWNIKMYVEHSNGWVSEWIGDAMQDFGLNVVVANFPQTNGNAPVSHWTEHKFVIYMAAEPLICCHERERQVSRRSTWFAFGLVCCHVVSKWQQNNYSLIISITDSCNAVLPLFQPISFRCYPSLPIKCLPQGQHHN